MMSNKGTGMPISAMKKKLHSKGVKSKTKRDLVSAMHAKQWDKTKGGLVEKMSLGGWIKENSQGILGGLKTIGGGIMTAVGTGLIATGIGAPIGAAMAGSGVSMMSGGLGDIAQEVGDGNQGKMQADQQAAILKANQEGIQNQQVAMNQVGMAAYGGAVPEGPQLNNNADKIAALKSQSAPTFFNPSDIASITPYNGKYQDWSNNVNGSLAGTPQVTGDHYEFRMKDGSFRYIPKNNVGQYYQGDLTKLKKLPMGGMVGAQPNVEVEKQEVAQQPNGEMQTFDLPSHEQATSQNQVALEPGTRIFSDRLKTMMSKKAKATFADEADALRKQIEKYEQILYS